MSGVSRIKAYTCTKGSTPIAIAHFSGVPACVHACARRYVRTQNAVATILALFWQVPLADEVLQTPRLEYYSACAAGANSRRDSAVACLGLQPPRPAGDLRALPAAATGGCCAVPDGGPPHVSVCTREVGQAHAVTSPPPPPQPEGFQLPPTIAAELRVHLQKEISVQLCCHTLQHDGREVRCSAS